MTSQPDKTQAEAIAGFSALLGVITGVAGLVVAVFAFFSGNWLAAGVCLGAAALAFGLVANAALRH